MIQRIVIVIATSLFTLFASTDVHAALIGATAELSTLAHNVSGTVTITDEDSFRVDNFTYDGGGPAVYFYLATAPTHAAFVSGLEVLPLLTGSAYDGTQGPLYYDLPAGETFAGYHAISVWCAQFGVDFGSGAFTPIQGDLDSDGFVGITDLGIVLSNWNLAVPPAQQKADPSGDGLVGIEDLNIVLGNWNAGTPPSNTANTVPEPASVLLLGVPLFLLSRSRTV